MTRLAVEYAELAALAAALKWQAEQVGDHALTLTSCAASGDIAQALVIAPAEAAHAETTILAAATRADLMLLELEARALATDAAAELYKRADQILEAGGDAADAVRDWAEGEWKELQAEWADFYDTTYPFLLDGAIHELIISTEDLAYLVFDDETLNALTGGHWPTDSHEEAAAGLLALLENLGVDVDPDLRHDPLDDTDFPDGKQVDLLDLMKFESTAYNDHHPQVVITTIDGDPPRYIVNIPGTDPLHPFGPTGAAGDLNTLADAAPGTMSSERSELVQEVLAVMRDAGIDENSRVMLSGHSLGGMAAASIASDPDLVREFGIAAVATQGSPIAHYPIQGDVSVFSVEHTQDPIPQLDGADNPDRTSPVGRPDNWTTVSVEAPTNSPVPPHGSGQYVDTLEEYEHRADVEAWVSQNSEFFGEAADQQASRIHTR